MTNTNLVVGSIAQVARSTNRGMATVIADALASGNCRIIGIDNSGSMATRDCSGGEMSRYEKARRELETLQQKYSGTIIVVSFNETAQFCLNGAPDAAEGQTLLSSYFELVRDYDGLAEFFVICDGELDADDYENCKRLARQFRSKINTIYVGSDADGAVYMREIAKISGGQTAANMGEKDFAKNVVLMIESAK